MKKAAKILTLVFMFALAVTLVFGVSASAAEGSPEPKIVSKSAYFGDQTYLYFAVNNTSLAEGDELEVLLYTEDTMFRCLSSTLYNPCGSFTSAYD